MSLGLCEGCKRFARAGEACPFCGAVLPSRPRRLRPHVSRAALVMVSALVTQCDCKPEPIAQPYGAPPTPPEPAMDAGVQGNAVDAGLVLPKDKQ